MNELQALEYVKQDGKEVKTTSRLVAEKFSKRHPDVVRIIKKLSEKVDARTFAHIEYLDERGRIQSEYEMGLRGYMLLAMRFTGDEALKVQIAFVEAFELMAKIIAGGPNWQLARDEGKQVRRIATDVISLFVDYAKSQGSKSPDMYYMNFSKMINDALLEIEGEKPKNIRDHLNLSQLHAVSVGENVIAKSIMECMGRSLPYKEIYQIVKANVLKFASTVGRSKLGQTERQMIGFTG